MTQSPTSQAPTPQAPTQEQNVSYLPVCRLDQIGREAGVAALVHGEAVAVIRTFDDRVFALSNYDPFSKASVLSRGIVGTRTVEDEEVPYVASPIYKQGFDLRTGRCLDDPEVSLTSYPVRVVDGVVEVGPPMRQEEARP